MLAPALLYDKDANFLCAAAWSALPVAHALRRAADVLISAGDTLLPPVAAPPADAAAVAAAPQLPPPAGAIEAFADLEGAYEAARETARTVLHACACAGVYCAGNGFDSAWAGMASSEKFSA